MSNAKKRFEAALKKTDKLPDNWFGNEVASYEDLPSMARSRKVRKNIFIDEVVVNDIEAFCKKNKVSFTDIANDILRSFVDNQKKSKA